MPTRLLATVLSVVLLAGCNSESAKVAEPESPEPPAGSEVVVVATPQQGDKPKEASSKLKDAWNQLRKKGGSAVEDAGDLVGRLKQSGGEAGTSAMDWAQQKYQQARAAGETQATSTSEWIQEDLKQAGTWQYKVVVTETRNPDQVEKVLNELGSERWECYSSERTTDGLMLQLKRPNKSVIRSLPARDLLRLLPLLGMGGE